MSTGTPHATLSNRRRLASRVALTVIVAILLATPGRGQLPDAVSEWNAQAVQLTLLPASALAPVQQTRVMAAVQVAIHDAINAITHDYHTYTGLRAADPLASSPDAAAIAAAHDTLVALFPTHALTLQTRYDTSLLSRGLSPGDNGVAVGKAVAAAVLALRSDDGAAAAQFDYVAPGAGEPGIWVPLTAAPALLPGWGQVTPWVLRTGSQFRPGPPPPLKSARYARDVAEVQALGSASSSARTGLQTDIAQFWRASPTAIWNAVMVQMLDARAFDLASKAQAFGLMYLAAADASIACWDAKYAYNFWRPQPAIAAADHDGNDATIGDVTWAPLLTTPPHPEYPSGHTCNSSAMAASLEEVFGRDPGRTIRVTANSVTREWNTFDEGVDEVIEARIYSGIHFRTADEVGARLGRQVAQFVKSHALRRDPRP